MKRIVLALLLAVGLCLGATPAHAAQSTLVESWPINEAPTYCGYHRTTATHAGLNNQDVTSRAQVTQGGYCGTPLNFPANWISTRFWIECGHLALEILDWRTAYTSPVKGNLAGKNFAQISKNNTGVCNGKPMRVKQQSGFLLIDGWHYYTQTTPVVEG